MTKDPHPDVLFIINEPRYNGYTNRRVYVCTDGGIWNAKDIYNTSINKDWERRDLTYVTTQFYSIAGDGPTGRIVGGTQDNGTLCLNTCSNYNAILTFGGDGGVCEIDYTNPKYLYGEYILLKIHRATNGGLNAFYICNNLPDSGKKANFIAPFVLEPNDPNVMYAGGNSLWISRNIKTSNPNNVTWQRIMPGANKNICALAVAKKNRNVIWVARNDGTIYMTKNGQSPNPTWIVIDDNFSRNPLPNRYVPDILIDKFDPNTVYIAFGGYCRDNLYKTTDAGRTWTDVSGNGPTGLPDAPIFSIEQHPYMRNWLYVSTTVGIFATENGGNVRSTTNDGPANVSVNEVRFMNHSL